MMKEPGYKVTMLLADAAQAVNGKLYILGGGWSITGPGPAQMALAIKIEVPWTGANIPHTLELKLINEDGRPVMAPTITGDRPVELSMQFEIGRPAGLKAGTPLDVPLAINLAPLPLEAGSRFIWHCFIDGQTTEGWQVTFSTRPSQSPQSP
jgi:hypothetical protein